MRFKIYSKTSDDKIITHYFDNQTLEISTEDGIPVVLSEDPRCSTMLSNFSVRPFEQMHEKNSESIKSLRINLGFRCNFHCKYCYESKPQIEIHEDLSGRIDSLVYSIKRNLPNLTNITFWGGEPLVYIKSMKRLVPKLREIYPQVKFSTITNGSLLNLDNAKWLVENDVSITISHDGPAFTAYRSDKDPLDVESSKDGILYALQHGDNTVFNIVVSPENADLQKIIPFFESKLGFIPNIHFESIVKLTVDTQDLITPFDEATVKTLLNNMVAYGSTETRDHAYGCVRDDVSRLLRRLINQHEISDVDCMIASDDYLAVNMKGELLECHGNPYTYGTLDSINESKLSHIHSWKDRQNCRNCPFLVSCRGGCTILDEANHAVFCETAKIWHAGFFIAAWKILFNSTITRIESVGEL